MPSVGEHVIPQAQNPATPRPSARSHLAELDRVLPHLEPRRAGELRLELYGSPHVDQILEVYGRAHPRAGAARRLAVVDLVEAARAARILDQRGQASKSQLAGHGVQLWRAAGDLRRLGLMETVDRGRREDRPNWRKALAYRWTPGQAVVDLLSPACQVLLRGYAWLLEQGFPAAGARGLVRSANAIANLLRAVRRLLQSAPKVGHGAASDSDLDSALQRQASGAVFPLGYDHGVLDSTSTPIPDVPVARPRHPVNISQQDTQPGMTPAPAERSPRPLVRRDAMVAQIAAGIEDAARRVGEGHVGSTAAWLARRARHEGVGVRDAVEAYVDAVSLARDEQAERRGAEEGRIRGVAAYAAAIAGRVLGGGVLVPERPQRARPDPGSANHRRPSPAPAPAPPLPTLAPLDLGGRAPVGAGADDAVVAAEAALAAMPPTVVAAAEAQVRPGGQLRPLLVEARARQLLEQQQVGPDLTRRRLGRGVEGAAAGADIAASRRALPGRP